MSRFYTSIQGSGGEKTCTGTRYSGISGHVRGQEFGVDVWIHVNADGEDEARITLTSGSSDRGIHHFIGVFTKADLEELNENES